MGRPSHLRSQVATLPGVVMPGDHDAADTRTKRISRSYDRLRRTRSALPEPEPETQTVGAQSETRLESQRLALEPTLRQRTRRLKPPERRTREHETQLIANSIAGEEARNPIRTRSDPTPADDARLLSHGGERDAAASWRQVRAVMTVATSPREAAEQVAAVTLGDACCCCCHGVWRVLSFAKWVLLLHWAIPVTVGTAVSIAIYSWDEMSYRIMRPIRMPLLLVPTTFLIMLMLPDRLLPKSVARWIQATVRYAFRLRFSDATIAAVAPITAHQVGHARFLIFARKYMTIYGLLTLISGVLCFWHVCSWQFGSEGVPPQCSSSDPTTFKGHTSSEASSTEELQELSRAFGLDEDGSKAELVNRLHASTSPVDLLQCKIKRDEWKQTARASRWRQERNSWIAGLTFQLYVVTTYIRQLQEELHGN